MELLIATRFAWWPLATSSKRVNDYDMMRHSVQLSRWPRNIEKDLALRSPIGIYSDKVFSLILRMYLFLFFFR